MEQLDQSLSAIITQSGLFCMGVFLLTYTIRKVVETGWAGAKTNKWWTEVFLPLGPVATGVILAFAAKTYTWPEIVKDPWSRAFYGAVCGLSSGWVYSRFRGIMKAWIKSPIPSTVVKSGPEPTEPSVLGSLGPVSTSLGSSEVTPVAGDAAEDKTPTP